MAAVDPTERPAVSRTVVEGSLTDFAGPTLLVDREYAATQGWSVGQSITLTQGTARDLPFRVVALVTQPQGLGSTVYTTFAGAQALGMPQADDLISVYAAPGADRAAVQRALEAVVADQPTISVQSADDFVASQKGQVNQLLTMIYALLALAVVIAVLGIVNTLALSVLERTREIGVLRAIGLRRRQTRRMVRLESTVIAVLGATLGIGLGLLFGLALQRPLASAGLDVLAVPWTQLVVFFLLALLVGVLAAVWPARRAARMDVLAAISTP